MVGREESMQAVGSPQERLCRGVGWVIIAEGRDGWGGGSRRIGPQAEVRVFVQRRQQEW